MKAISLWQPWASLVVLGAKKIETRSWYTSYRGPLVIKAAKKKDKDLLTYCSCRLDFIAALKPLEVQIGKCFENLPFGALLGTVELVDCRRTESFTSQIEVPQGDGNPAHWRERDLGNFDPGRFGWVFVNPVMFPEPIPYKGQQGFFEVNL